jgi:hypothetical protein
VIGWVQATDSRADMVKSLKDTPVVIRQFGDDPLEINDLSLLQLRSAETH